MAGAATPDSGTVQTRSLPERFIGGKTDQLDYQTDVTRFTQVDDPEAILTNQQGMLSTPQRSMDRAVIPRDDTCGGRLAHPPYNNGARLPLSSP